MRASVMCIALGLAALPAQAQVRQDPERLRQQVVERFLENYRNQAALTPDQSAKLEASVRRQWEARRMLQERERGLLQALEQQLRPGVAADQDSVTKLLNGLTAVQTERVRGLQAEQEEYKTFLSPVQRAQLVLAFQRLERQIQMLMQQRMQNPGPRRFN